MKRLLSLFLTVLLSVTLLVACGGNDGTNNVDNNNSNNNTNVENTSNVNDEEQEEITIELVLSENEGEDVIDENELTVENGAIVLDVLEENFDVEEDDGFITSIDGLEQDEDEGIGWIYYVNDEMAMVGANEYELEDGDVVNFDYQPWE